MDGFPLQGLDFGLDFRAYGLFWDAESEILLFSHCQHTQLQSSHKILHRSVIMREAQVNVRGSYDQFCARDFATKEVPILTQKKTTSNVKV